MFIYLLAFLIGVAYWVFIVFAFPKFMTALEKQFIKFMPEFGAIILTGFISIVLGFCFLATFRCFKVFVPDQEWQDVSQIELFGVLFAIGAFQLRIFLLERQGKS